MKRKIKGFTLIELLVVIVIIGILATISVSSFNNYRRDAENTQRITVVTQYLSALQRMNASDEGFPVSTGLATSSPYPSVACLLSTGSEFCWQELVEFVTSIKAYFDKHISGVDSIIATTSGVDRSGLIYQYPLTTAAYISNANSYGFLNPAKTMRMAWVMAGENYACEEIPSAHTFSPTYNGGRTYCVSYVEDLN